MPAGGMGHAGRPSASRRRETAEDLLLKLNFPMEPRECQGRETKRTCFLIRSVIHKNALCPFRVVLVPAAAGQA